MSSAAHINESQPKTTLKVVNLLPFNKIGRLNPNAGTIRCVKFLGDISIYGDSSPEKKTNKKSVHF